MYLFIHVKMFFTVIRTESWGFFLHISLLWICILRKRIIHNSSGQIRHFVNRIVHTFFPRSTVSCIFPYDWINFFLHDVHIWYAFRVGMWGRSGGSKVGRVMLKIDTITKSFLRKLVNIGKFEICPILSFNVFHFIKM